MDNSNHHIYRYLRLLVQAYSESGPTIKFKPVAAMDVSDLLCPVPTSTFRATVCYGLDIRGESW